MLKTIALAGLAALLTACAAPAPVATADPLQGKRGSTATGESTAAELGFHGPVYRARTVDGPN